MKKPIYLIGGTAGTGKTTLAREIAHHLKLDHRLGTGFVREIVRSETTLQQDPDLFTFTFNSTNPIHTLNLQAKRIHQSILNCIGRARNEGTSLIIEGTHLIPELYAHVQVDGYIILSAPASALHRQRLEGTSHLKRDISKSDMVNARLIDQFLHDEANKYNVSHLLFDSNFGEIVKLLTERF